MQPHVISDKVAGMWNVVDTFMAAVIQGSLASMHVEGGDNQHRNEYG